MADKKKKFSVDDIMEQYPKAASALQKAITAKGGAGDSPTAETVIQDPISTLPYRDPADLGLPNLTENLQSSMSATDNVLNSLDEAITAMDKANSARLQGQIPDDVVQQVRMASAESASSRGLGVDSPAARNLVARDLGLTSLDIQQQGLATQAQVGQLRQNQADLNRLREGFFAQHQLSVQTAREEARRTDLNREELELRRKITNVESNLNLIKMIGDLTIQRADVQYRMAASDIDSSNVAADYNNLIGQLDRLLAKNAGAS